MDFLTDRTDKEMTKDEIVEILIASESEVDNWNMAVFAHQYGSVADAILRLVKKSSDIQPVSNCSTCGKPHRLRDEDAGTEREIKRLCIDCC